MTPEEQIKADMETARSIAGPPPIEPVYQDLLDTPDIAPGNFEGGGGQVIRPGSPGGIATNPNNALLSSNYQAKLTAYNALVLSIMDRLRAERRSAHNLRDYTIRDAVKDSQ